MKKTMMKKTIWRVVAGAAITAAIAIVMFNPQPDPPGRHAANLPPGPTVEGVLAFNPQPDPPGRWSV